MEVRYVGYGAFYDMTVPGPENYAAEGLWHHNTGKTDGAAHYVHTHMTGPPCDPRVPGGHRLSIAGPTQADAVSACVTGVSGLQAIDPAITVTTGKEGTTVRWTNGAVGKVMGGDTARDVNRARAWTNVCLWWVEEAGAIPLLGGLAKNPGYTGPLGLLDQAPATLRLCDRSVTENRPHIVATFTPINRPEVKALLAHPGVETWGRTRDATRLDPDVREALETAYPPGTTVGRQELDGEMVGDVAGALWIMARTGETPPEDDRPGIENDRMPLGSVAWRPHGDVYALTTRNPANQGLLDTLRATLPPVPEEALLTVDRVAVGVDPAGGATENGIAVVGTHAQHGYTLADLTLAGAPLSWGLMTMLAWYHFGAEGVALERTFGGDQTDHSVITAAEELGLNVPAFLKAATAEGKKERASPVQTLGQVHRLHMVGHHPRLEGEMTTWVEDETPESPNRLDAWVHAHRHLMVRAKPASVSSPARLASRMPSFGPSGGGRGRR